MSEAKYSTYELRVRAVQALQSGMPAVEVAAAYGIDRTTLYRWKVRHDEAAGPQGLLRRRGSGRPRKLQELTAHQWRDVVLQPAGAFGFETAFWTTRRVHQVITRQLAASVSRRTILRRLREAGLTYQ